MKKFALLLLALFTGACTPEIGSEAWCQGLKEKPKGEWTIQEVGDYTRHCLLK